MVEMDRPPIKALDIEHSRFTGQLELTSPTIGHTIWHNGELKAVCVQREYTGYVIRNENPFASEEHIKGCNCGIHATHSIHVIGNYLSAQGVIVELALGGNIAKHTRGYRAERARVERIIIPDDARDFKNGIEESAKQVAERLNIPCITEKEWKQERRKQYKAPESVLEARAVVKAIEQRRLQNVARE